MEYSKENEKIYLKIIGKKLRELRQIRTQKSLVLFTNEHGISHSTLSRIERGETQAGIVFLKKMSVALDMSFSELIAYLEEEIPENFCIFGPNYY